MPSCVFFRRPHVEHGHQAFAGTIEHLLGGHRFERVLVEKEGLDQPLHLGRKRFAHSAQRLRQREGESLTQAIAALASGEPARVRAAHWNALALPAMRAYPAFTRFTSEVERRLGRAPCLSGTGSTLFDVADDPADARDQAQRLEGLGARVVVARCG